MISGGGAYGTRGVGEASALRQADLVVPPRRNGKPWRGRTTGATGRNESLHAIERLAARDSARQVVEVPIRCAILNTFNALGMHNTVARA